MNRCLFRLFPCRRFLSILFGMATGVLIASVPESLDMKVSGLELGEERSDFRLIGSSDRRQLLVTAAFADGKIGDYTRQVVFRSEPAGVVAVDATGWMEPLADGSTELSVESSDGLEARINITVEDTGREQAINFANQVVPIFTKTGCNGGGCHGKSGGQNGFRLSLLGFEPTEDYEYLVYESRGRRIFPAAPEHSLLLRKATGELPHGGGKRLEKGSVDYDTIYRWIRQGMPYGEPGDPTVEAISVYPDRRVMRPGDSQQLSVVARYTDGSLRDVTRGALYEPNVESMAEVTELGLVKLREQVGEVGVMVRYQSQVAVFRATVPLGTPVEQLPPPGNFIDDFIFAKLQAVGVPPSGSADDATFLRRTALDVAGRLPTPQETIEFLRDRSPDKRDRWIDTLLEDPGYSALFANKWSALLRNRRNNNNEKRGTYLFHDWIRESLRNNLPYDRFVASLLTASGDMRDNPPVAWYRRVRNLNEQVEDTAQLFLGVRLQCAQCHHHPFEVWSQQDYYRFAAFFSRLGRTKGSGPSEEIVYHQPGLAQTKNLKTGQFVRPAGLGVEPKAIDRLTDPRMELARWMTDSNNPFFARSLVNRYWKHFFGRGIVDPEDDMRATNPPTHPDLLAALSRHFVDSGYDLKGLVRLICQSRTYQLSSIPNQYNGVDKQHFSRYYPKRLMAEILYDSIYELIGAEMTFAGLPPDTRAVELPDNSFNSGNYFLTVFGRPDSSSSCECERSQEASLAQSLHLINSGDLQKKLAADTGRAAALAQDASRSPEEKISEIYLLALSRYPSVEELELALAYLDRKLESAPVDAGDKPDEELPDPVRMAYEDIIWALINTKEFLFNH